MKDWNIKELRRGTPGAFGQRLAPSVIDHWHARNQARGPRPGTWWKRQRLHLVTWLGVEHREIEPTPIYTRPAPKRQRLHTTSFHPGMMRLGRMMRGAFVGKAKRLISNTRGALKRNHSHN